MAVREGALGGCCGGAVDNARMDNDQRRHSAAAERNQGPILAQLLRLLPAHGVLLEIASGTGQHAAHCAPSLPGWRWQPSDGDADSRASITAWCQHLPQVLPPLHVDVMAPSWPAMTQPWDAIFCANLLHIAPWAVCAALMQGAARHLAPQGLLILYGPFLIDGVATAPGNLAFDIDLRSRNPAWGLRRLGDVLDQAQAVGLHLQERVAMPANNQLLVLRR
jgi:Protein of unknown function (DUF938)